MDLAGSVLLKGFIRVAAVEEEGLLTEGLLVVVGFLSIDNNSAEDNLTLEFEADFKPVAAEAKLSI